MLIQNLWYIINNNKFQIARFDSDGLIITDAWLSSLEAESNIETDKTNWIINGIHSIDDINVKSITISTYSKTEVDTLISSHAPDYGNNRAPIVIQNPMVILKFL
jgi:hypothetical protein